MGFWSALGNIGKIALNVGTGGLSGLIPGLGTGASWNDGSNGDQSTLDKILGVAGRVAGGLNTASPNLSALASGRAQGRIDQSGIQQAQDRLAQQRYGNVLNAADTDLARRKFSLTAPETRMSNAVHGDVLANAQDFSYGAPRMVGHIPVPTSTGGLRPSILSPGTRTLGQTVSADALKNQQAGDNFAALPDVPGLTPLPQAGAFDKILTTAGTVGALAPTFADLLAKYKRPPDTTTNDPSDWATQGVG